MPDHSGLRGSDMGQDTRFKDKEAAAVKATHFPAIFSQKVDLRKCNITVLKPWIAKKVIEIIRVDDDIVVEFVFSMIEDKDKPSPDPKKMQVSLLGFMDKYGAAHFMEELWTLLLSAQTSPGGIPAKFVEAKKAEIQSRQSGSIRFGASIPAGRPDAAAMFDEKPRIGQNDTYLPGRSGRDGDRRNDQRDNGYGRGGGGRYDDRPRDRGYERERDSGYGNRSRRSPSPRRDDRGPRDRESRRRPTPPRRPSPPRRRSPSPRRRSPSPRRRDRSPRRREISPTRPKKREARDDTPPARRARSPSDSPPRRRRRSPSRTPTPSDPRGRSRSPTVTPPRKRRDDSTPPRSKRRDDSTPPRKRRSPSDSPSPPPQRRRRYDSTPPQEEKPKREKREEEEGVRRKGRGSFSVDDEVKQQEKPKKKLEGALGKSRWADE